MSTKLESIFQEEQLEKYIKEGRDFKLPRLFQQVNSFCLVLTYIIEMVNIKMNLLSVEFNRYLHIKSAICLLTQKYYDLCIYKFLKIYGTILYCIYY